MKKSFEFMNINNGKTNLKYKKEWSKNFKINYCIRKKVIGIFIEVLKNFFNKKMKRKS